MTMEKNRVIIFWGLCVFIVSLVIYGVGENRALTNHFSGDEDFATTLAREKKDIESSGSIPEPENVTVEFDYKDAE